MLRLAAARPRCTSLRLLALLAGFALGLIASSCRLAPTAPLTADATRSSVAPDVAALPTSGDGGERRSVPPESQVPVLSRMRGERRHDTLVLTAQLRSRDPHFHPYYDPARIGGWSLQVFVDSDPASPGYWMGYDYIVRGGEWDRNSRTFVCRQITLDDSYPGGWGPQSGTATVKLNGADLEITIPLAAIGSPAGRVPIAVETYATVGCDACDGGMTAWYVDDTFGVIGDHGRPDMPPHLATAVRPAAGHSAAIDPRLMASASR